jgi:uncharacterized RDD family membrane protein YckC
MQQAANTVAALGAGFTVTPTVIGFCLLVATGRSWHLWMFVPVSIIGGVVMWREVGRVLRILLEDPFVATEASEPRTGQFFDSRPPSVPRRLVARLIDITPIAAIGTAAGYIAAAVGSSDENVFAAFFVAVIAGWPVYHVLSTAIWGRTLGKLIVGIRVQYLEDGRVISSISSSRSVRILAAAIFREWIILLSLAFFLVGALVLVVATARDRDHRGWHDKAVGTIVVRTR